MSLPKVTLSYSNGNLLQEIAALDGIGGIVGTINNAGLYGVPKQVFNLPDAVGQGFTLADEPFLYNVLKEFYAEIAGNQELWVMGVADTMTMTQMLDKDDADAAIKLRKAAEGKISVLIVCRKPDGGYDAGNSFLDADVETALTATIAFCADALAALQPLRVLIEGRVNDEDNDDILEPNTIDADFGGVVLGSSAADSTGSVGVALGRAMRYAAHIKIGKVANGPLSISEAYIGTKKIKDLASLESLHDKGYISFMRHPQKAGVYFGIDHMANTSDYRLLAYGRVIDKAAKIAAAVYVNDIESEVDVDPVTGFIAELDIKHLESRITQQINVSMADQISGLEVYINPAQDIINTSTLALKLRIIPKGYTSFITIDLGLKAPILG